MRRDVVVIGASAGGLPALTSIVGELPRSLPASLLVVVHAAMDGSRLLPTMLGRASALPAAFAAAGDRLAPDRIYVAPPDRHLIVQNERLSVVHGPRENAFRPAIDPLFRTAGQALGPRVIGVIQERRLDDATADQRLRISARAPASGPRHRRIGHDETLRAALGSDVPGLRRRPVGGPRERRGAVSVPRRPPARPGQSRRRQREEIDARAVERRAGARGTRRVEAPRAAAAASRPRPATMASRPPAHRAERATKAKRRA
jgi:hypothetical protein